MGMFGGDNELGNILQEAVKLKSAQMGEKRKQYETWPYFVQHTLFHGEKDDFKAWRQLPFAEKIEICEKIKEEGNELYAKGQWTDAVDKYEEAPTLVYYCYSTDPGWRKNNRGIDDDVLVLVDDQGSGPEEAEQHRRLRLSCCLNLAACKQKLAKYDEVVLACDTALQLDPTNVKALYRRAEARVRPSKSTAYDLDLAVGDLAKAHEYEPKNQVVERLLVKLRAERKVQREKDHGTFGGMFDRGEIYDGSEPANVTERPGPSQAELDMKDIQQRIEGITDEDTLEKRTADAELLRDLYMRNGKEEEAKDLNEKIKVAKDALKTRETTVKQGPDWDNPTEDMIEDAKKHGLDLTDPVVVAELKRLEREGLDSLPPEEDEAWSDRGCTIPQLSPEAMSAGPPVPWIRYFVLFGIMVLLWRIADMGVVRYLWRSLRSATSVGSGSEEDFESTGGTLEALQRGLVRFFGGDPDDEL
mmetsp:Transcript_27555/g.54008  ORF Transcript_27555/g.54008 Transcript_27555/m.54008 type:complete len:472 (+) Transcript_27555:71-1486(+)